MNKNIHHIVCLFLTSVLSGCSFGFFQPTASDTIHEQVTTVPGGTNITQTPTAVTETNNNITETELADLTTTSELTGLELELHQALKQDISDERVRALLQQGADSNSLDEYNFPAFFYLLAVRSADLARLALEQGADPNIVANDFDAVQFTRNFWQPASLLGALRADGDSYVFNLAQQQPRPAELNWPSAGKVPNELFIEQIDSIASVNTYLWRAQALSQRDWLRPRDLLEQNFALWLAEAQQRRMQLDPIPNPVLPEQEQISKGAFESNSMFQRRLGEVINDYQSSINSIASEFSEQVETRNQLVLDLQNDTRNKITELEVAYQQLLVQQRRFYDQLALRYSAEVEPRLIIEAFALVCGAFELKRTNPNLDMPDYNPETEVMRALLTCSRSNYAQTLSFSVAAGEAASNFYQLLAADKLRPQARLQINEDKQISISQLQINLEGQIYAPFNELSPAVPAGIDLSEFFNSRLIMLPQRKFEHPEIDNILALEQQEPELAID